MNENILALDQSLTETGWYCKDGYGVILTDKKDIDRMLDIRGKITQLIKKYKINIIVIEDFSFASKGRAIFELGGLGWMLRLLASDLKINLVVVDTSMLKKFITGKGNSKKEVMLLEVYKKYGFDTHNNNIADAFALFKFYEEYIKWKGGKSFTKLKIEEFKKLKKVYYR